MYNLDGERTFAGWSPIEDRDAALGSHLYRIESDPETDESVVARYRLGAR